MKNKRILLLFLLLVLAIVPSCRKEVPVNENRVVVAISSDIESTNPAFAFTQNEGNIAGLLYASLVQHKWNFAEGKMDTYPMLAKSWQWSKDSSSVNLKLRDDVKWSDGKPFTSADVVFTFDVYSDPLVQSRFYGTFKNFYADSSQHVNLQKTFTVNSPYDLTINFKKGSIPSFFDIDFPIIPQHIYAGKDRKNLVTIEKEIKPVTDGAFKLASWEKNQAIILKQNKDSFLYNPQGISEIIFKIVPDYNSQLTQLKNGEIDFMQDVKAGDVAALEKNGGLDVSFLKGTQYDFIGWNNIDPELYAKSKKVVPNKLFGDPKVRTALSYAVNRKEILQEFLNNYGQLAAGPIAPIFKSIIDTSLEPIPYDPDKAKQLLASAGWKDEDNSGVLKKNGIKFSFTLNYPSGNPLREFAANVIQNNLKAVGISAKLEPVEPEVFFQKMFARELNAWISGWSVQIPVDMKVLWHSNLDKGPFNVVSFQNKSVDMILDKIEKERSENQKAALYKELQDIIYKEQPVTFLYWIDNIIAFNNRIQNVTITPLGPLDRCWEWSIKK